MIRAVAPPHAVGVLSAVIIAQAIATMSDEAPAPTRPMTEYRADGTPLRRPPALVRRLVGELFGVADRVLLAGFPRLGRALAVVAERIDPMGAYSAEEPEA